jgi:hypothetical protein
MALSTRKKNIIIADWKTGKYKNPNALAKAFKIDRKTALKLVDGISSENASTVEAGVKYELEKSQKNPAEKMAIEKAVKEKTAEERMRDIVMDNTLKISVHTTTASMKKLQENAQSKKDKLEPSELIEHQRLAKLAKETVAVKEEKPTVENHLNMQQMVLSQEETNVDITVNDLESEALVKLFKDRNLPT